MHFVSGNDHVCMRKYILLKWFRRKGWLYSDVDKWYDKDVELVLQFLYQWTFNLLDEILKKIEIGKNITTTWKSILT